jgi:3',5'-cyclic AMP phosphodiesterase CpdA
MKRQYVFIFLCIAGLIFIHPAAQTFRFALLTDTHISTENISASTDLSLAVDEINKNRALAFVLVDGDIADHGDSSSLKQAKTILDRLTIPYYITSGNHDSDNGHTDLTNFINIFGNNKFVFQYAGFYFVGFPTGPVSVGSEGHISAQTLDFLKSEIHRIPSDKPIFLMTHYPLLDGDVDNWRELLTHLDNHKIVAVLNGHYHRNALLNYNGIPGIVNRSTLRGKAAVGGYSLFTVGDSLQVSEKIIGRPARRWLNFPLRIIN